MIAVMWERKRARNSGERCPGDDADDDDDCDDDDDDESIIIMTPCPSSPN